MITRRALSLLAAVAGLALLLTVGPGAEPAAADNCQTFTDCFATADAASDALLGLTFLGMLSMALNFIPYVGTAKGIIEAITGRDLLTGERLTATDRLLGLIPGGLGRGGRAARMAGRGDDLADGVRVGGRADDAADGARVRPPDAPAPRPGGAAPPAPPPGRGRPPAPPGEPPPRRPPPGSTPDRSGPWGHDRSRVQGWRETWWDETRPRTTRNGGETSVPRRNPSVDHRPAGNPEPIHPNAGDQMRADIRLQNRNANTLAEHGFDVRQQPGGVSPQGHPRTADYEINGHHFEHKVPHTSNVQNFVDSQLEHGATRYASRGTQADRFVVDLNNGNISPEALRAELISRGELSGVQEVLVIKNGDVLPIFP